MDDADCPADEYTQSDWSSAQAEHGRAPSHRRLRNRQTLQAMSIPGRVRRVEAESQAREQGSLKARRRRGEGACCALTFASIGHSPRGQHRREALFQLEVVHRTADFSSALNSMGKQGRWWDESAPSPAL